MDSRRPSSSSSSASTAKSDKASSAFKRSLKEDLGLWVGSVPAEIDPSFQSLIQRHLRGAGSQLPAKQLFEPKDQHCGIWKDAPNKECHASFGDQGTTASVSCYGDVMQMSRFLGAGQSGVFSIDHMLTDKPYWVDGRAEYLHKLGSGSSDLSFGVFLPDEYLPNDVPEVKWVNWRWPRYEWNISDEGINVNVSIQWLVKNNTVFQQIVITNKGASSIEDFSVRLKQQMLIRDLNYTDDPSYNEDDSESYIRGRGPSEFSWITTNILDKEESVATKDNEVEDSHAAGTGEFDHEGGRLQPPRMRDDISENKQQIPLPEPSCVGNISHRTPPDRQNSQDQLPSREGQTGRPEESSVKQHQTGVEQRVAVDQAQRHPQIETERPHSDDGLWQKRRISDTWSATDARAVVSLMSLYVNGTAQKMGMEPYTIHKAIGAAGSGSNVLEITVAYRMIAIPKDKLHWQNFLIPVEAADVSAMLAAETEKIWGHSTTDHCKCSQSLCDLGLSTVEPYKKGANNQGQTSQNPDFANHGAQNRTAVHVDATSVAYSQMEANAGAQEASAAARRSNRHSSAQDTSAMPTTHVTMVAPQKFSHINFAIEYITWRHTEHILSVCTIPLSAPTLPHKEIVSEPTNQGGSFKGDTPGVLQASNNEDSQFEIPLAFTCGDMSGHRVCTSASFFAFEFLMGVLRRLPSVKQTPYIVSLQRRIDAACRGHIRWLEWVRKPWFKIEDTASLLDSGCFAANYWVNGTIMPSDTFSWQPDDAITDTPFQILKVTAYIRWLQRAQNIQKLDDKKLRHYLALLRDVWVYWINELDDLDKRKACAWRHASKDGVNTYRLDDHFWLWNSLNELYYLDFWSLADANSRPRRDSSDRWVCSIYSPSPAAKLNEPTPAITSGGERDIDTFLEFSSKAKRLLPKEVQRAVLQRFTVENDVSQERMLAVTRSARETRFFFHTRDTALFYGHDRKFFLPETPFNELWERTIRSQSHHEEALEEEWQSPLRSALGVVAGLKGFSIDKNSPAELTRRSLESLIRVGAHNAFIPGEVDVTTSGPSIFSEEENRDYYYHVGFEICHILLAYARELDAACRSEQTPPYSPGVVTEQVEANTNQPRRTMDSPVLDEILAELKKHRTMNHQYSSDYRALAQLLGADGRLDRKRASMVMKKSMPFNNMIDASSITTLDEEWLYNYPDFLLTKNIDLNQQLNQLSARRSEWNRPIYHSVSSIIDKALESLGGTQPEDLPFKDFSLRWDTYGLVASVPKQKSRRKKRGKRGFHTSFLIVTSKKELWDSISKARSAMKAKKRFLCLPLRSDSQTALLCWLASTEAEKSAMSLFFDRHAEYENHLWDDTTMVLNVWQTELHMSFWVIHEKEQTLFPGLPHPIIAPWPRGSEKELRRASVSFRFDGDFFDRYWTCHFIQNVPGSANLSGVPSFNFGSLHDKHSWQRKVLELQLLQHMLNLILAASNRILSDVETELGLKKGNLIFSVLTTEAYSLSEDRWQIYEELLQKAEEDITSSLNTLSKWATREVDRGQERPRWTRNDERKYRGYINKLHNHTERQRWDLESCRDKLCKLRETLITRQDKVRADLETNREQNIRYFTYVTIIFLPLGFASSFYSMNGAPSNDLIISLAKFAAAAFAVTAILVLSVGAFSPVGRKALSSLKGAVNVVAKSLVGVVDYVANHAVRPLQKYLLHTREGSLLVKGTSSKNEPDKSKMLHQAYSKKDWMLTSWFWPAYLILELPTLAISTAWTTVGTGSFSFGAVWRVALGIVVLPIYAMSRAMLGSFGNAVLLLTISRHLYRRCKDSLSTKRTSEVDHTPERKVPGDKAPDEQVRPSQPSFVGDSEKRGESENIPAGKETFPGHFQELMPTTEPLRLLQSLERRLGERKSKAGEE